MNNFLSLSKHDDDVYVVKHASRVKFSTFSACESADAHFLKAESERSWNFTYGRSGDLQICEVFF